ncbi:MAG: histidinol-phosphate transaminase [Desertifilum sp.]|nr:histidinol-phosphate transaminase [Desertifilum sp.]
MLPFIRSAIRQLNAYKPHPGGTAGSPVNAPILLDRIDSNESPYDLPEELKQKLASLCHKHIEANRYPDGSHLALKEAIAQYVNESAGLTERGITPAQVTLGNGSDELIRSVLVATCLQGEGSILVADPTFSMYAIIAETLGVPVVKVGRSPDSFEMDLEAATAAIQTPTHPPIRVVFVVHPNSPTGNALTAAEIEWLRQLPEEILVVIDEAYFEFSQQTLVSELLQRSNWLILRTFSKAFRLAAYRVGYAVGDESAIAALEKVRLPYNLPSVTQVAAQLAIAHRHQLLATIPQTLSEREHLYEALSQYPAFQVSKSAANFIFIRFNLPPDRANQAAEVLCQQLRAKGTVIRHTCGGLRITIGTPEENQRTQERLAGLLKDSDEFLASLACGAPH